MQVDVVSGKQGSDSVDLADRTFAAEYNQAHRAPGRLRLPGGTPSRNEVAKDARRGAWRRDQALAAEGSRTGAGRKHPQSDLAWRRGGGLRRSPEASSRR